MPGALLHLRAGEAARDHPEPEGRPGRALRALHPVDPRDRATDVLDEARPAPARAVGVPAGRPDVAPARPGAAARDADDPRLLRRLPAPPQRAAPAAPARVRRPASGPPHRAAEARGHLRRHARRGDGGPRLRLEGGCGHAPQRQPVERRRAGLGAHDRQAAGAARRTRDRRAGADARRDTHDRRRAERAARVPPRRPVGVLARGGCAPDRADRQARLQLGGEHLEAALDRAPRRCRPAAAGGARIGRLAQPVHRLRAAPRPDRAARGGRADGERRARHAVPGALVQARAALQRRGPVPDRGPDPRVGPHHRTGRRDCREWPNRRGWAKLPSAWREGGELLGHGSGGLAPGRPQLRRGARGGADGDMALLARG